MNNPHYESVRAKVIAACSDYVNEEKKFKEFMSGINSLPCDAEEAFGEIPDGPALRLSHVLRALAQKDNGFELNNHRGDRMHLVSITDFATGESPDWNLELDLAQQDPSVWEALDKMLT